MPKKIRAKRFDLCRLELILKIQEALLFYHDISIKTVSICIEFPWMPLILPILH